MGVVEMVAVSTKLSNLDALASSLIRTEQLPDAVATTLATARDGTVADAAELFLVERETGKSLLMGHRGLFPEAFSQIARFGRGEGYPGLIALSGEPIITQSLGDDDRYLRTMVKQRGIQSYFCLPLTSGDGVLGCLNVALRRKQGLEREDWQYLQAIAGQFLLWLGRYSATAQERKRLAREMHDGLIQSLGLLKVKADALQRIADAHQLQAGVVVMKQMLEATLSDARCSLLALRPPELERDGFLSALNRYLEGWRWACGLEMALRVRGKLNGLAPHLELALLRIIQEAMSNVVRHSGAGQVVLELRAAEGRVVLTIRDNGRGFDLEKVTGGAGLGLLHIRERVEALGGNFTIDSAPGQGTAISVLIPTVREAEDG